MGDPRKIRKTYRTPGHPWEKARLEEEDALLREYGIKNKKEIWKMRSMLENFKYQSKSLVALKANQAEKEKIQLVQRLKLLGLLKQDQSFDDILGLSVKDILERRFGTLVHRKGLAKTMHEARQFITYGHMMISGKEVTSPSYIVTMAEEPTIMFNPKSSLADPNHPQRIIQEKKPKKAKPKPQMHGRREGKDGRRPRRNEKRQMR